MTNVDYLFNKDAAKNFFDKNHHADKQLGIRIVERGTIVPYVPVIENGQRIWEFGGLVDGGGKFVGGSVGKFGADDTYTPSEEIPFVPATVVYLGLFYPIWGHFITEGLRYNWFLLGDAFKKIFGDCPLVYVPWRVWETLDRQKNFRRLLELSGVDVDSLQPITQPTRFANVILPDESFFLRRDGRFFTDEYRATIDRVRNFALKNRTPSAEKIYFFYGNNQVGEERLAEYFRAKGYEIISPERLPLDDQLNILINAESFASTLGSCSHNSVFLRDGSEVILVPRAAERFTAYQRPIDQVHPLNINYVDSSLSVFDTFNGPYCFILSRELKKFFGDTFDGYSDDDLKTFLTYVKLSMGRGLKATDAENYYGATLTEVLTQLKARTDLTDAYGMKLS